MNTDGGFDQWFTRSIIASKIKDSHAPPPLETRSFPSPRPLPLHRSYGHKHRTREKHNFASSEAGYTDSSRLLSSSSPSSSRSHGSTSRLFPSQDQLRTQPHVRPPNPTAYPKEASAPDSPGQRPIHKHAAGRRPDRRPSHSPSAPLRGPSDMHHGHMPSAVRG